MRAQEQAKALGLTNIRFECLDVTRQPLAGPVDLVIATHALVQAEQDPGLPSLDWRTFERADDPQKQRQFEERTGVGLRLDRLCDVLGSSCRAIIFEKTRSLARRVPFQRALAVRGLALTEQPKPIRYQLVEEIADDGPFYVLTKGQEGGIPWDESPEPDEGRPLDASATHVSAGGNEPLYENHHPSAQQAWQGLRGRWILKERTKAESDGRQFHIELGRSEEGAYLYCANTFDQRQLVLVEPARISVLDAYYQEIVGGG
jgi:hypothetical protein